MQSQFIGIENVYIGYSTHPAFTARVAVPNEIHFWTNEIKNIFGVITFQIRQPHFLSGPKKKQNKLTILETAIETTQELWKNQSSNSDSQKKQIDFDRAKKWMTILTKTFNRASYNRPLVGLEHLSKEIENFLISLIFQIEDSLTKWKCKPKIRYNKTKAVNKSWLLSMIFENGKNHSEK